MKFKMNDREWEIVEVNQAKMKELLEEHNDQINEYGKYFGLTYIDDNMIYLAEEICKDQKRLSLMHELMHCYISCYISNGIENFDEEMVCNISANSHDIIHKIVKEYFNGVKK